MEQTRLHLIVTAVLLAASTATLLAQVSNGDFSSNLDHWNIVLPSSNTLPPGRGIVPFDIDGPGPLGTSSAFFANVGSDALLNLEQTVTLSGGVTYNFRAGLAMTTPGINADGGTVSVFIGPNFLTSYSFGDTFIGINKYSSLSSSYLPAVTGPETLSIRFSRGPGVGGVFSTPTDYIDNIQLTTVPEPGIVPLAFSGLSIAALVYLKKSKKDTRTNAVHAQ